MSIRQKSKLFLGMSIGTRGSYLMKKLEVKNLVVLSLLHFFKFFFTFFVFLFIVIIFVVIFSYYFLLFITFFLKTSHTNFFLFLSLQ
jgi:hypothetical protein